MFRPQKQQEATQRGRQRLEPWTQTPTIDDVTLMMSEAEKWRGSLIEVYIRRPLPPVFVLTCQFDPTAKEPIWSLYEGEDGSKVVWNYPNSNLEMIWEIICMSLPGGIKSPGPIAAGLAPQPAPAAAQPAAAPPPAPYGAPQPPYGAPYPGQAPYPQAPYPQGGAPQPGYPQGAPQPPYPGQPYPQAYPPPYPHQPAQQPQYPQPGYGAPMPQPGYAAPAPTTGGYPAQPYPYGQPAGPAPAAPAPANVNPDLKPTDLNGFIDLLQKSQQNILLGNLFIESGILPEPCVEAALKLQELVRKGLLSNNAAIEALRRAAERGGLLDDDVIAACRSMYPESAGSTAGGPLPAMKSSGTLDPREVARQIIILIQQAGIVSDNDVSTAEGVRRKHGGDVGNILVAAGKIEKATLEAARRCFPLLREHRLNHEEVYRVIRHCQKTKASVEDACQALSIRVL